MICSLPGARAISATAAGSSCAPKFSTWFPSMSTAPTPVKPSSQQPSVNTTRGGSTAWTRTRRGPTDS
eukprot:11258752-Alexandrium_andersonii.AAC.1